MSIIRILLAEDNEFLRARLRKIIDGEAGVVVVGETDDSVTALSLVKTLCPDVVLMDGGLPSFHGMTATQAVAETCPRAGVIVLTESREPRHASQLRQAGAVAYLSKTCSADELMMAVHVAAEPATDSCLAPVPELELASASHPGWNPLPRSQWLVSNSPKPDSSQLSAADSDPFSPAWKVVASILRQVRQEPASGANRSRSKAVSEDQLVRI